MSNDYYEKRAAAREKVIYQTAEELVRAVHAMGFKISFHWAGYILNGRITGPFGNLKHDAVGSIDFRIEYGGGYNSRCQIKFEYLSFSTKTRVYSARDGGRGVNFELVRKYLLERWEERTKAALFDVERTKEKAKQAIIDKERQEKYVELCRKLGLSVSDTLYESSTGKDVSRRLHLTRKDSGYELTVRLPSAKVAKDAVNALFETAHFERDEL